MGTAGAAPDERTTVLALSLQFGMTCILRERRQTMQDEELRNTSDVRKRSRQSTAQCEEWGGSLWRCGRRLWLPENSLVPVQGKRTVGRSTVTAEREREMEGGVSSPVLLPCWNGEHEEEEGLCHCSPNEKLKETGAAYFSFPVARTRWMLGSLSLRAVLCPGN